MDSFKLLTPLIITVILCFGGGLLIRLFLSRNPSLHSNNHWWKRFVIKMMVFWGRLLMITFIGGLLFGWVDGIINLPKGNFLHSLLQTSAVIFFGFVVSILQSYVAGLGFLLIPFREKEDIQSELRFETFQKKSNQIAVWIVLSVLLLSILVDWIVQLF